MRNTTPKTTHRALWIAQGLLAALFLFAGGMKLVVPLAQLAAMAPLPAAFMRFIGVVETLGALGLVLPGLTRVLPILTPLAAAGLVVVMTGAVVVTLAIGGGAGALVPFVVGVLAAAIAYGRWRVVPLRAAARRVVLARA
jgi:hypothetical protein